MLRDRCCARCRRGTLSMGELPCGYPSGCPNGLCAHYMMKTARVPGPSDSETGETK